MSPYLRMLHQWQHENGVSEEAMREQMAQECRDAALEDNMEHDDYDAQVLFPDEGHEA
jgi:hypothetical protein